MTTYDHFGLKTTLSNPDAIEDWNQTILSFLSHNANIAKNLDLAISRTEFFPMPHIASGFFSMLLGQRGLIKSAKTSFKTATNQANTVGITEREQNYLHGLQSIISGNHTEAINHIHNVLQQHPEDGFAAKLVHAIQFIIGDVKGMRSTLDKIIKSYSSDNPATSYIQGCYAFALEEAGDYKNAEKIGRQAFGQTNNDAWALHAVAHVYEMTNQVPAGIDWLQSNNSAWVHCNNFRFHCWWHLALFYLDRGQYDFVLSLYDSEIRYNKTDDYRDIANGASLLARLEIEQVDVGTRWEELAIASEKHTDDNCLVFADLHYMLSLTLGNHAHTAKILATNAGNFAKTGNSFMSNITNEVGIAVMAGISAYKKQNYLTAFHHLSNAWPNLQKIGGSHAQRDVFVRLTIESAIRSGRADFAKNLITTRSDMRGAIDGYATRKLAAVEQMQRATNLMQDTNHYASAG